MDQFEKWAQKEYSLTKRLLALIPAGLLFAFLIPFTLASIMPRLDQKWGLPSFTYGMLTFLIGVGMMLVGAIYAFWSIGDQLFKARGTPLPMLATQKLLISGPFRQCRNPMSFGTIMLYLGISILVGSVSAVAGVLILSLLLVLYIKLVEEKELEVRFGSEYREYKAQTPFLVPRIFSR